LERDEFGSLCAILRDHVADLIIGRRGNFTEQVMTIGVGGEKYAADIAGVAVYGDAGTVATVILTLKPEHTHFEESVTTRRKKVLTEMDAKILEGVAAGVPTVRLAAMVDLSRGGVEYHVTSLLRKLKVPNRTSLVSKAYAQGILAPGIWPPKVVPDFVV
jgi:DNA-binding NarL/FixJ family response regulator